MVRTKLEIVLHNDPKFIDKIRTLYDRIKLIQFYSAQLAHRYSQLVVYDHSITPNNNSYERTNKTTYVDMSTGTSHTSDMSFPEERPIYSTSELNLIKEDRPLSTSELRNKLSKQIAQDLIPKQEIKRKKKGEEDMTTITSKKVNELLARIGNISSKRRRELDNNKNKYFEGQDELLTQTYLNSIQLQKNLIINYSRFYHSLFLNWHDYNDFKEFIDVHAKTNAETVETFIQGINPDDIENRLTILRSVLYLFNPEISNRIIDRAYVYQSVRYGNRTILANTGLKPGQEIIDVASSIEDLTDKWVPTPTQPGTDQEIISKKLRRFLLGNLDDTEKCYQSMSLEDIMNPDVISDFLQNTLLQDIWNVYVKLNNQGQEDNLIHKETYSIFIYRLINLMVNATDTFFQSEELNDRLNYLRQSKIKTNQIKKNAFSSEMIRIGRIGALREDNELVEPEKVEEVQEGEGNPDESFYEYLDMERDENPEDYDYQDETQDVMHNVDD